MTWVMNVGALRPRLSDISGVLTCRAYEEDENDDDDAEEEEENDDNNDYEGDGDKVQTAVK